MPKFARLERVKITEQVKSASGLSSKANKANLICSASLLFGKQITTHHAMMEISDAAFRPERRKKPSTV